MKAPAQKITVERVNHALDIMAEVIDLHGTAYLPIYRRLEAELEKLQEDERTMASVRARLVARRHR